MKAVRTKLDATLTSVAGEAAGEVRAEESRTARLMVRAMAPAPTEALLERTAGVPVTSVKLLVRSSEVAAAAAWVDGRGGSVDVLPGRAPGDVGVATLVCRVDPGVLGELEDAPWALRAEAPRILLPKMDVARGPATGLDAALANIAGGLTGAGVLVAVIDSGVDWRHPDFRHDDGSSRIERFVHAFRPEGALASTFDVYSQADIDAALRAEAGPPGETKEVPDGDPVGHGTHCASIAVGNGRGLAGGRFRGVAPQAALMTMRSEPLFDDHTIAGISQAFELAGDRPAVVSISLGSQLGAHDGTSALEVEIDRQSGPGRIVVVAAGNEGDDAIHAQGQLAVGTDLVIPFRISDRQLQFVDVWIPRGDDVDVFLETPSGTLHEPTDQDVETSDGDFHVTFVEDRVNRDQNLLVVLANGRVNDTWAVRIRPNTVTHGEVHAWAGTLSPRTSRKLFSQPGPGYSVSSPATAERCIAVGSLVSKNSFTGPAGDVPAPSLTVGGLSPFSSVGPTRASTLKPDITAPGQFITAALAAGCQFATDFADRVFPGGSYLTIQGTSMATPFVAGIIALMLQQEPRLTPEEVRHRLRATARRDPVTGPVWNPRFGLGKLDAAALLTYNEPNP